MPPTYESNWHTIIGCSHSRMLCSECFDECSWLNGNPESWPINEILEEPSEVNDEKKKVKLANINVSELYDPFDLKKNLSFLLGFTIY